MNKISYSSIFDMEQSIKESNENSIAIITLDESDDRLVYLLNDAGKEYCYRDILDLIEKKIFNNFEIRSINDEIKNSIKDFILRRHDIEIFVRNYEMCIEELVISDVLEMMWEASKIETKIEMQLNITNGMIHIIWN